MDEPPTVSNTETATQVPTPGLNHHRSETLDHRPNFNADVLEHIVTAAATAATKATSNSLCHVASRVASEAASQAVHHTLQVVQQQSQAATHQQQHPRRPYDEDVDIRAAYKRKIQRIRREYARREQARALTEKLSSIECSVREISQTTQRRDGNNTVVAQAVSRNEGDTAKMSNFQTWMVLFAGIVCVAAVALAICGCVALTRRKTCYNSTIRVDRPDSNHVALASLPVYNTLSYQGNEAYEIPNAQVYYDSMQNPFHFYQQPHRTRPSSAPLRRPKLE